MRITLLTLFAAVAVALAVEGTNVVKVVIQPGPTPAQLAKRQESLDRQAAAKAAYARIKAKADAGDEMAKDLIALWLNFAPGLSK